MANNLFGQPTYRGTVLGCSSCPADKTPGLHKIKGFERIKGQKAFVFAQSPGRNENEKRLELVGESGKLLWSALKYVGIERSECVTQNVVRCYPVDAEGRDYDIKSKEFKQMLLCCGPYNDEALKLNKGRAQVYLILGEVAGQKLLGKAYRKDTPIFWYEPWNAYVVLSYHPSYLLRKGGEKPGWDYYSWRDRLRAVRATLDHPGQYGYVKSLDNREVRTSNQFDEMEKHLRSEAKQGRLVSVDIEDGTVDGKRVVLLVGFGTGRYRNTDDWRSWEGTNYSVVLDHPENKHYDRKALVSRLKTVIEDSTIKKCLQNGSYDYLRLKELLGVTLKGYEYDTRYGTYLRYSFLHSFSLESQTTTFLPEFQDYKDIVGDAKNYADVPLDKLLLRNWGDVAATKMLEVKISPQVPMPLVKVYIQCAFTLDRMEKRGGPYLDLQSWKRAMDEVTPIVKELKSKLAQIAGVPDFNPASPTQVAWLVYDHLQLPVTEAGRSTHKDVLSNLYEQSKHPVLPIITQYRRADRVKGTYLTGYKVSAEKNNGRLTTIWWLTGAITGRLRSGRGDKAEAEGIVNLQNIDSEPLLQNLLTSDPNWRLALEE